MPGKAARKRKTKAKLPVQTPVLEKAEEPSGFLPELPQEPIVVDRERISKEVNQDMYGKPQANYPDKVKLVLNNKVNRL